MENSNLNQFPVRKHGKKWICIFYFDLGFFLMFFPLPSGFYLSEKRKQAGAFLDSVNVRIIHMNVDC